MTNIKRNKHFNYCNKRPEYDRRWCYNVNGTNNQTRMKEEKKITHFDGIPPTQQRHTDTLTVDRSKAINRGTQRQQSTTQTDTEATITNIDGHGDGRDDDKGDGDGIINEMARRQQSTTDTQIHMETMIKREKETEFSQHMNVWRQASDFIFNSCHRMNSSYQ